MTVTDIEEVYKAYFRDIHLYILGLSKNEHIAEEVTEETFFRAMTALADFRGECDIRVWLCRIAKNEYFSYLRKNKKNIPMDMGSEDIEKQRESMASVMAGNRAGRSIEEQLIDSETAAIIHQKVHDLPEPYKEVFHLRVFGELSFEQIGKIFGKTANWACVTYHRAKAKIQKEVEDLG